MDNIKLGFGEVFINTGKILKPFETLGNLRGSKINFFGGGDKKAFVVYTEENGTQKISGLHPPEIDEYDYTISEKTVTEGNSNLNSYRVEAKEEESEVIQLRSSKNFNLIVNKEYEVMVTGQGDYGVLGLGNKRLALSPIPVFRNRETIKNLVCGSGHCLLLTEQGSLYVWGRNFEGQLGLPYVDICCKPMFNPFFNYIEPKEDKETQKQLFIKEIYAADCHSFAILSNNCLYSWGDNLYGQLGLPTNKKYNKPSKVDLDFEVKAVVTSKTHTILLSTESDLYSSGLNNYGQLGLAPISKMKNSNQFIQIKEDFHAKKLPKFKAIKANYNSGMALSEEGELYVWGKSMLLEEKQVQPVKLDSQKEIPKIDSIFLTDLNCVIFSKFEVYSIYPALIPSSGDTNCVIRGYGLTDFNGKQRIRFKLRPVEDNPNMDTFDENQVNRMTELGNMHFETDLEYNDEKNTFELTTPIFFTEHFVFNCIADIELNLDDTEWFKTDLSLIVYNCNTKILDVNPKFVHKDDVQDCCVELTKPIEFEDRYCSEFEVSVLKMKEQVQITPRMMLNETRNLNEINSFEKVLSVSAAKEDVMIKCQIPQFSQYETELTLLPIAKLKLGVSLNKQQLLESMADIVFYKFENTKIEPGCVNFEGGLQHELRFDHCIESSKAHLKFSYGEQTATIQPKFDSETGVYRFYSPPFKVPEITKEVEEGSDEKAVLYEENIHVEVEMTLCGSYYQKIGCINYHKPVISKLLNANEKNKNEADDEYKNRIFALENPFFIDQTEDPKEIAKKEKEVEKNLTTLENGLLNSVKRTGDYIFVLGDNFLTDQKTTIRLKWDENFELIEGTAKDPILIVFELPEFTAETLGVGEMTIEVSFNNKQFTDCGLTLDYLFPANNMETETKDKEIADFLKKYKKPKKAK